jgi:hypothetical protein
MRRRHGGLIFLATPIAALAVVVARSEAPVAGQTPTTYKAPRGADGRPNLNGIWQAVNTANWNIEGHEAQPAPYPNLVGVYLAEPAGMSVVVDGRLPYKPEALAKKKQNFEARLKSDPFNRDIGDPEAKCFMPGVPRATYMPFPFQIIQSTNKVLISYEYASTTRVIHMDKVPPAPIDSWMGQSTGRWEGDTLVVDVTGLNGKSWLDRAGNYLSASAHVVERYTPTSPDHLAYEATIDDPTVFTRPWKMSMPLYRRLDKNAQLLEFKCVEFSEDYIYGALRKK